MKLPSPDDRCVCGHFRKDHKVIAQLIRGCKHNECICMNFRLSFTVAEKEARRKRARTVTLSDEQDHHLPAFKKWLGARMGREPHDAEALRALITAGYVRLGFMQADDDEF